MALIRIGRFANQIGNLLTGRQDTLTDANPRLRGLVPQSSTIQNFRDFEAYPTRRVDEMKFYDYLQQQISDVPKALDAITTMATTGDLAGGGTNTFTIRLVKPENEYPPALLDRLKSVERLICNNCPTIIRAMCKYGSFMPQVILNRQVDGQRGVSSLKPIPPGTIFRYVDKNGQSDVQKYWKQVIDGRTISLSQNGSEPALIPLWMMPHFAIWSDVVTATQTLLYGTSLLRPFAAVGLKMQSAMDAIMVARLTRAAMRYVWAIDVSDIKDDQQAIIARTNTWKNAVTRSESLLSSGNPESWKKAPVPDEDFFIPSADSLKWGIDTISGDTGLGNVKDLELLARFYFGALGVPPEYIGHERSQGGRSSLTQIDIHFARTVRNIQLFAVPPFEQIVMTDMILGGWDPRDFPIQVVPPNIGARDDLLQAQIRALQSAVISNLVASGMDPTVNPRWILETFLNFDDELSSLEKDQIEQLFRSMPGQNSDTGVPTPNEQRQIWDVMRNQTGDLMNIVRENLRMFTMGRDQLAGDIYRTNQPTATELMEAIQALTK
jgi:hypothetical protein